MANKIRPKVASNENLGQSKKEKRQKTEESSPRLKHVKSYDRTPCNNSPPKEFAKTPGKEPEEYNAELLNHISRTLVHNPWYHGLMPRDEIEELLVKDGDFLVRKTEVSGKVRYAITVFWEGRVRHALFTYRDNLWALRSVRKPTIPNLIETHMEDKIPVMADGTMLIKPVTRPSFYILHDHIELKQRLGGGNFGDVFSGTLKTEEGTTIDVAIKQLKGTMLKKQRANFVKEAKLMRRFEHPNIVRVYGVAPQEEPMLIILELAMNGCLKEKLKKHPELSKETLTRYTMDACRGMCYLAGRGVIHRDIAARNCLIGKYDEVKISDFGLSIADRGLLKLDKLKYMPIKWLSPEVLRKGEFSGKSDVWSFGVFIWEVFSYCKTEPFPGENNAAAKIKILSGQQPMYAPDGSPEMIKNIMARCFTQEPTRRPDFIDILKLLAPNESPPPPCPISKYITK